MISRVMELSRRLMSGGRGSRFLGGALYGALIGAVLLLSGLAACLIAVLTGLDEFSIEGLSIAPLYMLSFALAGGVVGLLWKLTAKIPGAILAGFLGMLVVSTGCLIIVGFELVLEPLPEVLAFMVLYSALLGTILGLSIWSAQRKPKPNPRDDRALDRLLAKCGLPRQALNDEQANVLLLYCRNRRQVRWVVLMTAVIPVMCLYAGLVFIPNAALRLEQLLMPTHFIIVDKASGTTKDVAPNNESAEQAFKFILYIGGIAGMMAAASFMVLVQSVASLIGDRGEWTLRQFLKATATSIPAASDGAHGNPARPIAG